MFAPGVAGALDGNVPKQKALLDGGIVADLFVVSTSLVFSKSFIISVFYFHYPQAQKLKMFSPAWVGGPQYSISSIASVSCLPLLTHLPLLHTHSHAHTRTRAHACAYSRILTRTCTQTQTQTHTGFYRIPISLSWLVQGSVVSPFSSRMTS